MRTQKEGVRARGTHFLETAEGITCQITEGERVKGRSPTGGGRGRNLSEHGKKATEGRGLTSWRRQREELVRTRKERDSSTETHFLNTTEQEYVRTRKESNQETLTCWRQQRGTCEDLETNRPGEGDSPTVAEGVTREDMERNRPSEGHSHSGDMDL